MIGKLKLKPTTNNHFSALREKEKKGQKHQVQKIFDQKLKMKDQVTNYQSFQGTGMVVSSGNTLVGTDTKFKSEVTNGDFIVIENLLLKTTQQKQVMVVLGDKSILLKDPFIDQVTLFSKFKIQKKPQVQKGQDIVQEYKKKMQQIKKTKLISKDTTQLRVRKGMWTYEKKTVQVNKNATRQELLDIRAKKIKDKFCY